MKTAISAAVLFVFAFLGAFAGGDVPWPMPRGDGGQTGASPYAGIADPWPVPVIYARDLGRVDGLSLELSLYCDNFLLVGKGETVFFAASGYDGHTGGQGRFLVAVDPAEGRVRWTFPIFDETPFQPAIGPDGTVYVYDAEGNPVGLDPGTGGVLWRPNCEELLPAEYAAYMCPEGAFPSLGDYAGDILVGPGGTLYLYYRSFWTILGPSPDHPRIGASSTPEPVSFEFHPAIGENGWLYIVSASETGEYSIKALSPDGKGRWSTPIGVPLTERSPLNLVAGRRRVFVVIRRPSGSLEVMALDGAKGKILWRKAIEAAPPGFSPGTFEAIGPPVFDPKGRLYLVAPRGDGYWLEALDTGSRGRTVWSVRISTYSTAARDDPIPLLLAAGGKLFVGREEGLLILDAGTGERAGCPASVRVFGIAMGRDAAYLLGHAGGEALLMKTVPNRPPRIVSLSVRPESFGGVPERVGVRISYAIEDPLGWNRRVSLRIDYGDGEGFADESRSREADGVRLVAGTLAHSYAPGKTYRIELAAGIAGCPGYAATAEAEVCLEYPEIARVKATPGCVHPGGRVRLSCEASPPEALRGSALTYRWDFGDGTTATGRAVEHVFAEPGEYRVRVAVDVAGRAVSIPAEATVSVSVRSPGIAVEAHHVSPDTFRFACRVEGPCGGIPERVRWEFGDGTRHEVPYGDEPAYRYGSEGDYTGTATVIMGDGTEFARKFTVHVGPPEILLSASPTGSYPGEPVSFTASVSGWSADDFAYYLWDFGDGSYEDGRGLDPEVSHVYRKAGTYTVTLKLGDSENDVYTRTIVVRVRNPLIPRFTYAPAEVYVGDVVALDGGASTSEAGEIARYRWLITNEGLGYREELTGREVSWSPPCWGGVYTVRLTVADRYGNTKTASEAIEVGLPPDRVCAGDILYHPSAYADEESLEEAQRKMLARLRRLLSGGTPDFDLLSSITGHVGIVACDGTVIEAVGDGVRRIGSVGEFVRRYRNSNVTTVIALRVVDASPAVRKAAVEFAESMIGKAYDLGSILAAEKQVFDDSYYCSELVWAAYQAASGAHSDADGNEIPGSIDLDGHDPTTVIMGVPLRLRFVMPDEIYHSGETMIVWRQEAGGG